MVSTPIKIVLSEQEHEQAVLLALTRHANGLGLPSTKELDRVAVNDDVHFERHLVGALGQCAFASFLGVEPPTSQIGDRPGAFSHGIAGYYPCARKRFIYELIVDQTDPDGRIVPLLTANIERSEQTWYYIGWLATEEGRRDEWWRTTDGRACYCVPHAELHPPETLPGLDQFPGRMPPRDQHQLVSTAESSLSCVRCGTPLLPGGRALCLPCVEVVRGQRGSDRKGSTSMTPRGGTLGVG